MTTPRASVGASRTRLRKPPPGDRGERGAVLVEFALVVVLLFFVLYGIIAYGMAIALRQSMGQAAGEAARAAIVFPGDDAAKVAEAERIGGATTNGLGKPGFGDVDAVIGDCLPGTGRCITVTYVYRYGEPGAAIVPGGPFGVALPDSLTATAVARLVP